MKITGNSVLHAQPDKVWAAITDPAVLAEVIPGCQELRPIGDNHFALTVSMGVAAIRGTYAGEVRLYDLTEPTRLMMRAAGSGGPGIVNTTVEVRLTDLGDGSTLVEYDADATVGGAVGGVGQRVLTSVAKRTAGGFFSAIDDVITGRKPVRASVVGTDERFAQSRVAAPAMGASDASTGGVATAGVAGAAPALDATAVPAAAAPTDPLGAAGALGAVLVGVATALIGVIIGARMASRRTDAPTLCVKRG